MEGSQCSPHSAICPQIFGVESKLCCTRAFHTCRLCRIPCKRLDQQISYGGSAVDRASVRNSTSRMRRSRCRMLRCPAAKHAIGVTVTSNNFSFELMEGFAPKHIHVLMEISFANCRACPPFRVESNLLARRQPLRAQGHNNS